MMKKLNVARLGMRPTRWGPIVWYFLFATIYYWEIERKCNVKQKKKMIQLIKLFLTLLYCRFCRDSFNLFWQEHDPEKQLKEKGKDFSLLLWLYEIHEQVNQKLDKPSFPFSLVTEVYTKQYQEQKCWNVGIVSNHYYYCFWCILYLLACNYPPSTQKSELESDVKIRKCVCDFIIQVIPLFPSEKMQNHLLKSIFNTKYVNSNNNNNNTTLDFVFKTRAECFDFIYDWELQTNDNNSLFGKHKANVIDYFESNFRTPKSK